MVRSGTISGDVADKWIKRIKDSDRVKKLRDMAEKGDVSAMEGLGYAYFQGLSGLAYDVSLAQQWFLKAAEKGSVDAYSFLGDIAAVPEMKAYWWTRSAEG